MESHSSTASCRRVFSDCRTYRRPTFLRRSRQAPDERSPELHAHFESGISILLFVPPSSPQVQIQIQHLADHVWSARPGSHEAGGVTRIRVDQETNVSPIAVRAQQPPRPHPSRAAKCRARDHLVGEHIHARPGEEKNQSQGPERQESYCRHQGQDDNRRPGQQRARWAGTEFRVVMVAHAHPKLRIVGIMNSNSITSPVRTNEIG